jgi:flagellin-like protein
MGSLVYILVNPKGGMKEKMKNYRKSKRALSPVVASIILIAVTVAVSIAVAAWMGALTVGFMGTEELKITSMTFDSTNIYIVANNTGTTPVTINDVWVNNVAIAAGSVTGEGESIGANSGKEFEIDYAVVDGNNYQVKLVSSKGNTFLYTAVAPAT